ncbi:hypothetical protein WA1_38075 [Scytonema hofmannii PCC 7110]|uniref:Uncharacterized protein n=1 Tax=Scytonema hofmannii PCC 7110 TaxID=128403 RepID=A0A139X0B8_9CYAN|nr:hypothetical protein WA1_38075 [Scytonema hofmannii PCC 7110]
MTLGQFLRIDCFRLAWNHKGVVAVWHLKKVGSRGQRGIGESSPKAKISPPSMRIILFPYPMSYSQCPMPLTPRASVQYLKREQITRFLPPAKLDILYAYRLAMLSLYKETWFL